MKIFVVHYKKLTERRTFVERQLKINNMEAEFVDQYDRDTLTESEINMFHSRFEDYKKSVMAITLSHLYCFREIAAKYDYGMIFEDDVILSCNFNLKLKTYMEQLPDEWDMLFIGDGCGFHIPEACPDINIYKKGNEVTSWGGNGATRCVDSYLVSNKCAKKVIEYLDTPNQIGKGIDWWLNMVCQELDLKVYWAEPTIVTQGSQKGMWGQSWS